MGKKEFKWVNVSNYRHELMVFAQFSCQTLMAKLIKLNIHYKQKILYHPGFHINIKPIQKKPTIQPFTQSEKWSVAIVLLCSLLAEPVNIERNTELLYNL